MSAAMPLEFATVSFAELCSMMHCGDRTLRRWLRKKGIAGGIAGRIPLDTLRAKWPEVFNSYLIAKEPKIACPDCGGPTMRACLDGDCSFAQP